MDDQRDYAEETYNRNLCPLCDCSPCVGKSGKGSCEDPLPHADYPHQGNGDLYDCPACEAIMAIAEEGF